MREPYQLFGQVTSSSGLAVRTKSLRPLQPRPASAKASGSRALPDALDADGRENVRGRKRPLTPNSRATAQRVRIIGACARCHEKHEQVKPRTLVMSSLICRSAEKHVLASLA